MIPIRFNLVEEFIEELRKEAQGDVRKETQGIPQPWGNVRDGIVRVTSSYIPSRVTPNVQHVTVLASFITTRGYLVKLSHPVGELWGIGGGDAETRARRETVVAALTAATTLGWP